MAPLPLLFYLLEVPEKLELQDEAPNLLFLEQLHTSKRLNLSQIYSKEYPVKASPAPS